MNKMGCNLIDYMCDVLPTELIHFIISKYIFLPSNISKIKKQKLLKKRALKQLKFISNIIYIDNKICVYSNNNSIIFHNNSEDTSYMSLYGLNENITSNIIVENNEINEISSRLNEIQASFNNIFNTNTIVSTSNIVINDMEFSNIFNTSINTNDMIINTTHSDMNNVSLYIMYV